MDFSLEKLIFNKEWARTLNSEFNQDYFIKLNQFIKNEYSKKIIFPEPSNIFFALNNLDLKNVKVVILGQDPYHGQGEAHGLSFSVQEGISIPPSLRNIYKELESDIGVKKHSGLLTNWLNQGVLLLNAVLTVEKDKAGSHQKKGWEAFTDKVISCVNEECEHVVFILWGSYAQKKSTLIDQTKHLIIHSAHPSPLSSYRGFFGSKPFSKTNIWLSEKGLKPIEW